MADLLVKLYNLPSIYPEAEKMEKIGVCIRKPIGPENYAVIEWIKEHFGMGWASESETSFFNSPKTIYIAIKDGEMIGFACYDATVKGFFGPTGVKTDCRGLGVGKALLLYSLHGLKELGYGYGIIGSAGPVEFYKKTVGAIVIEDSSPGVYKDMLRLNSKD